MLFGWFDLITYLTIISIFLGFKNIRFMISFGVLMYVVLFVIILPAISVSIELHRIEVTYGPWYESLEVMYTLFRFPMYWITGLFILGLYIRRWHYQDLKKSGKE